MNIVERFESYVKRGEYDKALPVIEDIIRRAPHIWTSWFNYGICLNEVGRPSEAADAFLKAFELNPEGGGALYRACLALAKADDDQRLLRVFKDTCAEHPNMIYNFLKEPTFAKYFQTAEFQALKQQYAKA